MRSSSLRPMDIFSGLVIVCFAIAGCDSTAAPAAATVTITPPPSSAVDPVNVPAVYADNSVLQQTSPTPPIDAPSSLPAP